ncbi:MAG: hypothetical protein E7042_07700 [Lentisphaerae bacterium]|nr:hypothetical protein [Lentisphaerota bacterium]
MKRAGVLSFFLAASSLFAAAEIPFERQFYQSEMITGSRPRQTPHTLIYGRIQPYNLYGNYLDKWIDRPLYHNAAWRTEVDGVVKAFHQDMRAAMEYEIEGFTMLGNAYGTRYRDALRLIGKNPPVPGFKFMPGMGWRPTPGERDFNNFKSAFESKLTPRINGKVPFFSYGNATYQAVKSYREFMKKNNWQDSLLFGGIWLDVYNKYRNGILPAEHLANARKALEARLGYLDGVILTNSHMYRNPAKDYFLSVKFYPDLDKKYLAPMFEKVFSDPKFAGKLLGFNVRHCYVGHMSGVVEAEQGTLQLREAIDTAMLYNPDIISLVEWNEANENTSFQPTVLNGKVLMRLVRYYSRFFKGQKAAPLAGDDTSIPPLAVSVRRTVKLGEMYRLELLNIPDVEQSEKYSVKAKLVNENNQVILELPPETFDRSKLASVTFKVPSEKLANYKTVAPVLEIVYQGKSSKWETLRFTRLENSAGWDYKEVRTALRDIPESHAEVAYNDEKISASFDGGKEMLQSFELLHDDRELFAVDNMPLIDPVKYDTILVKFGARKQGTHPVKITAKNVDSLKFQPWGAPYSGFGKLAPQGNTLAGELLLWHDGASLLLGIPKNAAAAEIDIEVSGKKVSVPVAAIRKNGNYGAEMGMLCHVYLEKRDYLADHPKALNSTKAEFSFPVKALSGVFHVRAVTASGKVFRSAPIVRRAAGEAVSHPVYSVNDGKVCNVSVPGNEIKHLKYTFNRELGTVFKCNYPEFDGRLGAGFRYVYPMWHGRLPKDAVTCAPTIADGVLKFDGKGNYIVFPVDALPAGAFTVKFSCKPQSKGNMVLFRHAKYIPTSIESWIENGKLKLGYTSMGLNYRNFSHEFETGLEVKPGEWNDIEISYNYQYLKAYVNGKAAIFPFSKRPGNYATACFGGFNQLDKNCIGRDLKFFHGELRSLEIIHTALPGLTAKEKAVLEAKRDADSRRINVNGKFIGGQLPRQWYVNKGMKPVGKTSAAKSTVGNAVKLLPQPGAAMQIYCAPFAVKPGEVIKVRLHVKGKTGAVGINFYDAKSRYIRLGASEKFADSDDYKEYTFTVPVSGKGGIPALGRITLMVTGGNPAEFYDLTVSR